MGVMTTNVQELEEAEKIEIQITQCRSPKINPKCSHVVGVVGRYARVCLSRDSCELGDGKERFC